MAFIDWPLLIVVTAFFLSLLVALAMRGKKPDASQEEKEYKQMLDEIADQDPALWRKSSAWWKEKEQ